MLIINDPSDVDDPCLQRILRQRFEQLAEYGCPISDLARFYVIRPEDDVTALMTNLVDGSDEPSWEYVEDHGDIYEAVFILDDSGFGHVYFIPDRDDEVDSELLSLCRQHAIKKSDPNPG